MNNVNMCEYCGKTFANKYILKNHQQRAKKCLEIQGKIRNKDNIFECQYCNKKLQYKYSLKKHLTICASRINETKQTELNELTNTNKKLIDDIYLQKIEIQQKDIEIQEYKIKCQQMERGVDKDCNTICDDCGDDLFNCIRAWADERGLYDKGDPKTQYIKLMEETGEIGRAILKNDTEQIIDGIGDAVVVLTNLAELIGVPIEECIQQAYNVISKRKGKMINGTFVKDK